MAKLVHLPLNKIFVTNEQGKRFHPIRNIPHIHTGIDLRSNFENVYATQSGIVIFIGEVSGAGKTIALYNSYTKLVTIYMHLSKYFVNKDDIISDDQANSGFIIAVSGNNNGRADPHLHFEILHGNYVLGNGKSVKEQIYSSANGLGIDSQKIDPKDDTINSAPRLNPRQYLADFAI